ncbi:MAG TPA: rhodanese-like domain-containing protein [Usitatibacter sp.]|nr:rhodanese-like domain-containing protein [Usitatibacter sp.]
MSAREAPPAEAHVQQILGHAAQRGERMGLRYAGAVTPQEAHRLREAGAAAIVDVRTPAEYSQVGHVPETPLIEWPRNGGRAEMQAFLEALRARFDPSEKILFICRSGVRSHYAAELAAHAGYESAYNVLEGFEGEYGAGTNGWKAAGLPTS